MRRMGLQEQLCNKGPPQDLADENIRHTWSTILKLDEWSDRVLTCFKPPT
jgi:hypothetical protein